MRRKPLRISPLVQRQAEEEEEPVQMKREEGGTPSLTSSVESSVTSLRGGGKPLSNSQRAFFQPRFGIDFGKVRVHTDTFAEQSARAVNANAYAVGHDIVFGAGRFAPGTHEGQRLIAHELTHVVQQSGSNAAIQRQPAPQAEIEMPAGYAFSADPRKRTWRGYARSLGKQDAARIRKAGKLTSEDREEVNAKLRFFEGDAMWAYIEEIKPALLEVTRGEIEMPGTFGDVLDAIVAIMECAPVSSRESPIDKNPIPESSPCGPAYYTKKNVTKKEYVDLLWEWFRIANTWSQVTTRYRSPDPAFLVPGSAGRKQIAGAVAKTAAIVDAVGAAGGEQLVARYKGMVATFEKRAEYKAAYETEKETAEEIYKMDRNEISRQWDARKADFIAVASRPNKLDAYQLFTIYNLWYGDEYHDRWVELERVKHELWKKDQSFYAALMVDLEHTGGFFDALMYDLQQGRLREEVKRIYSFSPIDDAAIVLVPKLLKAFERFHSLPLVNPEKILAWLEDTVNTMGEHHTFQDVYDHAREMAEAQAGWGGIFQQMALGIASMPRPTPGRMRPYVTKWGTTAAAEEEAEKTQVTPMKLERGYTSARLRNIAEDIADRHPIIGKLRQMRESGAVNIEKVEEVFEQFAKETNIPVRRVPEGARGKPGNPGGFDLVNGRWELHFEAQLFEPNAINELFGELRHEIDAWASGFLTHDMPYLQGVPDMHVGRVLDHWVDTGSWGLE